MRSYILVLLVRISEIFLVLPLQSACVSCCVFFFLLVRLDTLFVLGYPAFATLTFTLAVLQFLRLETCTPRPQHQRVESGRSHVSCLLYGGYAS